MAAEENNNESVRPDATPSFDINSDYQSAYLKSNYESDEYHELKTMEEDLNEVVSSVILKMEAFASLRPMEAKDLIEGQEIKVNNEKKAKIVRKVNADTFVVKFNDGTEAEIKLSNIEPSVDPTMKLKKPQIRELYEICYDSLLQKTGRRIDIVYFFSVFTDYFRVNGAYLYACLRPKAQASLYEEMSKRTGIKSKKGINPIFMSQT